MTTATVTRTKMPHPTLLAASIGTLCVALGLLLGIAIGTRLAPTSATPSGSILTSKISSEVSTIDNPYPSIRLTMPVAVQVVLPRSAPGNPYVNIHVAGEVPAPAALQDSPGTSGYVNTVPEVRAPAAMQDSLGTGGYVNTGVTSGNARDHRLQEQRRGERSGN